jgi:hypothetical protein
MTVRAVPHVVRPIGCPDCSLPRRRRGSLTGHTEYQARRGTLVSREPDADAGTIVRAAARLANPDWIGIEQSYGVLVEPHTFVNRIMELASTQDGAEGFAFDSAGHKTDAAFHADLLGDEEDDPYAYNFDDFVNLTEANQERLMSERLQRPGGQQDLLNELLAEQAADNSEGRQVT